jgi:hypothetical protein
MRDAYTEEDDEDSTWGGGRERERKRSQSQEKGVVGLGFVLTLLDVDDAEERVKERAIEDVYTHDGFVLVDEPEESTFLARGRPSGLLFDFPCLKRPPSAPPASLLAGSPLELRTVRRDEIPLKASEAFASLPVFSPSCNMSAFPRLVSSSRSSCRVLFRSSPSIPRTSSSSSSSPLPPPSTTLQRRHLHSPLQQLTSHSPPAWSKPIDAYLAEHLPPHPTITPSSPSTSPSAPSASSPSSSYSPSASHPYFLPHSSTNTSLFYTARITAAPHRYWDIDSCLAVLEHEPHLVSSSALFWPWLFPTMEKASANPGAHPLHVVDVDLIHRYPEVLERYERAHKLVSCRFMRSLASGLGRPLQSQG